MLPDRALRTHTTPLLLDGALRAHNTLLLWDGALRAHNTLLLLDGALRTRRRCGCVRLVTYSLTYSFTLDLVRAPYDLYGVNYIDLVSLRLHA